MFLYAYASFMSLTNLSHLLKLFLLQFQLFKLNYVVESQIKGDNAVSQTLQNKTLQDVTTCFKVCYILE